MRVNPSRLPQCRAPQRGPPAGEVIRITCAAPLRRAMRLPTMSSESTATACWTARRTSEFGCRTPWGVRALGYLGVGRSPPLANPHFTTEPRFGRRTKGSPTNQRRPQPGTTRAVSRCDSAGHCPSTELQELSPPLSTTATLSAASAFSGTTTRNAEGSPFYGVCLSTGFHSRARLRCSTRSTSRPLPPPEDWAGLST